MAIEIENFQVSLKIKRMFHPRIINPGEVKYE
jgi:hypothetical protein